MLELRAKVELSGSDMKEKKIIIHSMKHLCNGTNNTSGNSNYQNFFFIKNDYLLLQRAIVYLQIFKDHQEVFAPLSKKVSMAAAELLHKTVKSSMVSYGHSPIKGLSSNF